MVVKGRSVKKCKKKFEKRPGAGEGHFSRRHRPLFPSHARLLFAQLVSWHRLKKGSTVKPDFLSKNRTPPPPPPIKKRNKRQEKIAGCGEFKAVR